MACRVISALISTTQQLIALKQTKTLDCSHESLFDLSNVTAALWTRCKQYFTVKL